MRCDRLRPSPMDRHLCDVTPSTSTPFTSLSLSLSLLTSFKEFRNGLRIHIGSKEGFPQLQRLLEIGITTTTKRCHDTFNQWNKMQRDFSKEKSEFDSIPPLRQAADHDFVGL